MEEREREKISVTDNDGKGNTKEGGGIKVRSKMNEKRKGRYGNASS